ncbi:type 1 glutamine amidotransferase domain-containing protein [Parapedobacter sp. DT-150]|uniref:type 1 glutamine amidotransferase domain-containing protein n=1 Tax=Parapedobacter sp. DT-150 TaxID=3396162 RepID=UPI003F1CDCBF
MITFRVWAKHCTFFDGLLDMKKMLMILTSHPDMENTDGKTGVWLAGFTEAYYAFVDEGFEVTLASPKGGKPPVDPMSERQEQDTPLNGRFLADVDAQLAFGNTWKLDEVHAGDFDAAYFTDGHGSMWDFVEDRRAGQLVLDFQDAGKPVALVGHGTAALIAANGIRDGFLQGRRITAFSNTEEALLKRHHHIPYELKTRLKTLGADCRKGIIPFTPHVEVDGLLVTGQNPQSAATAAQVLAKEAEGELLFG